MAPDAADQSPPHLICPRCRYDLTGLEERRCPECGTPFEPEAVRWWMARAQPVVVGSAVLHLVWPAAAFAIFGGLLLFLPDADVNLLFIFPIFLITAAVNSMRLSRKLAATIALARGTSLYAKPSFMLLSLLTCCGFVVQISLVFGACVVLVSVR